MYLIKATIDFWSFKALGRLVQFIFIVFHGFQPIQVKKSKYKNLHLHQNFTFFKRHFSKIAFFDELTLMINMQICFTNCLHSGELKFGLRLDGTITNVFVKLVKKIQLNVKDPVVLVLMYNIVHKLAL